ncbi:hypothetical protein L484_003720 [Morus notabilis]|uniref:FAM192A/Fyv6 N-terminal domain-containing protein n=1 Tax=Morus notabilis TaxID=981085 RepID=W9SS77_9ROSA|nr:hypothetical protein L484_003720 [Morus notabilis]
MNFVSEEQLDEAKRRRGERVEDGTAQRDRPLYEILKENKDKKDAEFQAQDVINFCGVQPKCADHYAAVAVQSMIVHELKETPPVPVVQEQKVAGKKNPPARPIGMIIKVKPQAKKARLDQGGVEDSSKTKKTVDINTLLILVDLERRLVHRLKSCD